MDLDRANKFLDVLKSTSKNLSGGNRVNKKMKSKNNKSRKTKKTKKYNHKY